MVKKKICIWNGWYIAMIWCQIILPLMTISAGNNYTFDEIQIYGNAHLAIQTASIGDPVDFFFHNMIGDRTGCIHIGAGQVCAFIHIGGTALIDCSFFMSKTFTNIPKDVHVHIIC